MSGSREDTKQSIVPVVLRKFVAGAGLGVSMTVAITMIVTTFTPLATTLTSIGTAITATIFTGLAATIIGGAVLIGLPVILIGSLYAYKEYKKHKDNEDEIDGLLEEYKTIQKQFISQQNSPEYQAYVTRLNTQLNTLSQQNEMTREVAENALELLIYLDQLWEIDPTLKDEISKNQYNNLKSGYIDYLNRLVTQVNEAAEGANNAVKGLDTQDIDINIKTKARTILETCERLDQLNRDSSQSTYTQSSIYQTALTLHDHAVNNLIFANPTKHANEKPYKPYTPTKTRWFDGAVSFLGGAGLAIGLGAFALSFTPPGLIFVAVAITVGAIALGVGALFVYLDYVNAKKHEENVESIKENNKQLMTVRDNYKEFQEQQKHELLQNRIATLEAKEKEAKEKALEAEKKAAQQPVPSNSQPYLTENLPNVSSVHSTLFHSDGQQPVKPSDSITYNNGCNQQNLNIS